MARRKLTVIAPPSYLRLVPVAARTRFEGHTKPVEEVVFKPGSVQELASVGDDAQVGLRLGLWAASRWCARLP